MTRPRMAVPGFLALALLAAAGIALLAESTPPRGSSKTAEERVPSPVPSSPPPRPRPQGKEAEDASSSPSVTDRPPAATPGIRGETRGQRPTHDPEHEARRLLSDRSRGAWLNICHERAKEREDVEDLRLLLRRTLELLPIEGGEGRAPLLLALATADHVLGDRKKAEEDFIEAILAMEPIGPDDRAGLPFLCWFALGWNVVPYEGVERERLRTSSCWHVSRSATVGRSSPLLYIHWGEEERPFWDWVLELAQDDSRPEAAMAAGIWTHAVVAGIRNTAFDPLPPAATKLVRRILPGFGVEGISRESWEVAFGRAVEFGIDSEDRAARALKAEGNRVRDAWRVHPTPGDWVGPTWRQDLLWSCREEVLVRFAEARGEKAGRLRALATALLDY